MLKNTFKNIALLMLFLSYSLVYTQNNKIKPHQERLEDDDKLKNSYLSDQFEIESNYKLRLNNREIPLSTQDGIKPNQSQLNVIKKVLVEDFLVNDDTFGGSSQKFPRVAINGNGDFIIVWEDNRNANADIFYQSYNNLGIKQGHNTKVNDDLGSADQNIPSVSIDGSGNFVIVWADERNGNSDIYFQRFNSFGIKQGVNVKVNDDFGSSVQFTPSVSMDGSGNFVIVWTDERNGNSDIYFQRFNSFGIKQGVNTKVNDDLGLHFQYRASVSMDGTGNFVIVWADYRNKNSDIYYQLYDNFGIKQGVNTKVNDDSGISSQYASSVSMNGSGNFVIVWADERNGNSDIYFQRFNSFGIKQGVNTKVNDDLINSSDYTPSVSINGSGSFVISWNSYRNNNSDIYYQRYNSSGERQGDNTKVNAILESSNYNAPSVSIDQSGNFVIVWTDFREGNLDIYHQRYNNLGIIQGVNTKVNDDTGSSNQSNPAISMNESGNFVIVWADYRNNNYDIYYQRYNNLGLKQGVNTKVNDDTGSFNQTDPAVIMDGNGNFIIVWEDLRNGNIDIYYQRYNKFGEEQGVNTMVNGEFKNAIQLSPSISMDDIGNFVIVWTDYRNSHSDIYYQRYNKFGEKQGVNVKVNDDLGFFSQGYPSVSMDGSGNFVIVWTDARNIDYDIYYQLYNNSGDRLGVNTKVNDDLGSYDQITPSVSMDGNGNFVIVWTDYRNNHSDIYYQRYNKFGEKQGVNTKVNDDLGPHYQYGTSISMNRNGNFVIIWQDYGNGLDNPRIFGQRYYRDGTKKGPNYLIVSESPKYFEAFPKVSANKNNIVFTWMDTRRSKGLDIYGKIVDWNWNGVDTTESGINLPKEFVLYQNYPNPFGKTNSSFNPTTIIRFSIPEFSFVRLSVYDILGREIRTILNDWKTAGDYDYEFDGRELPSGVYFCKIQTEKFVETKKMILIK